jgi:hypothetical protein
MNDKQRCLAGLRPRHNPAENALIANMRDDPNIPCLNSLAAMRHYARQRWPHDPAVQPLIRSDTTTIPKGTAVAKVDRSFSSPAFGKCRHRSLARR